MLSSEHQEGRGFILPDIALTGGRHLYVLSDGERADLTNAVETSKGDPITDFEPFLLDANLRFSQLPENLRARLHEFQRFGNQLGALIINKRLTSRS